MIISILTSTTVLLCFNVFTTSSGPLFVLLLILVVGVALRLYILPCFQSVLFINYISCLSLTCPFWFISLSYKDGLFCLIIALSYIETYLFLYFLIHTFSLDIFFSDDSLLQSQMHLCQNAFASIYCFHQRLIFQKSCSESFLGCPFFIQLCI